MVNLQINSDEDLHTLSTRSVAAQHKMFQTMLIYVGPSQLFNEPGI